MNTFKRFIKYVDGSESLRTRRTKKMIQDDGVSMVSASHGSTGCVYHGTLYVSKLLSVLRKQVKPCREDDVSFRPAGQGRLSRRNLPSMSTECFKTWYKEV